MISDIPEIGDVWHAYRPKRKIFEEKDTTDKDVVESTDKNEIDWEGKKNKKLGRPGFVLSNQAMNNKRVVLIPITNLYDENNRKKRKPEFAIEFDRHGRIKEGFLLCGQMNGFGVYPETKEDILGCLVDQKSRGELQNKIKDVESEVDRILDIESNSTSACVYESHGSGYKQGDVVWVCFGDNIK